MWCFSTRSNDTHKPEYNIFRAIRISPSLVTNPGVMEDRDGRIRQYLVFVKVTRFGLNIYMDLRTI